ncbi:MAG: amidohydrolase, partial [Actinomycetia bacterium]|nr:amidohydrolase [Actinomycetes bacterium]
MITVYTARRIITMDPSLPDATAIACRDGRIVEVGTIDSMAPWLKRHEHEIDERFADDVMIAGFIDPHVHPSMASMLLNMHWITPEPWSLPSGDIGATETRDDYLARLADLVAAHPEGPLITFGYHAQFHGEVERGDIDDIDDTRPVVLWQRSFHEVRGNSKALEWLNAAEGARWDPHIDLESGRMFESGIVWALGTLVPHLMGEGGYEQGLRDVQYLTRKGGVTTVADAGYGIVDFDT